jgi:glycosyltransferase involved in cell wall biosynthesis
VTLFASGDSQTSARLKPGFPRSLRLAGLAQMGPPLHLPMLTELYESGNSYDIIHSHVDYWSFPFARLFATPTVSTMHGRLDVEALRPIYDRFRDMALVSISDAQRAPLPEMNWIGTVYHGLPSDLLDFNPNPGKYLAFLGRISPEKRTDLAIDVALRAGIPFKIAAKVDAVDREYFETLIKPRLSPPDVEYIGEIGEHEKSEFLGNALALLFTIDWPEPFGLAMIESLACGTPVVTSNTSSLPEVVGDAAVLVKPENVFDIARGIREVLLDDALRAELIRRGREQAARFSWENTARQVLEIYLEAAAGV